MLILLSAVLSTLGSMFRSRAVLELEHMALRHQIGVLKRSARKRPKLTPADRLLWVFLSRVWGDWRSALDIVKPATALAWHRKGFRLFWTWKIRHRPCSGVQKAIPVQKGGLMKSVTLKTGRAKYVLGTILGVLLFSLALFAQANGRILGTVTDQTGAVIGGATEQ